MNILFAGKSDFNYNRVQVLLSGLKKIPNVNIDYFSIPKRSSFDKNKFQLKADWADYIFIPPFRHKDVGFIKNHTKTPVIFDPLISKYLTKLDYGHFWKLPIKFFLDKIPFQKADVLLTDTKAHREYFIRKFSLNRDKVYHLYIGSDTDLFFPDEESNDKKKIFTVGFYGSFVPLQGVKKIIEAANILKDHIDIKFELIGGGYTFKKAKQKSEKYGLSNIRFRGRVEYNELNEIINSFDVCLGIFGDSEKANLVIPNKIYHYASIGKTIITRESTAIKEIFTNRENIILIENTATDLANAILKAKENSLLLKTLGTNAYQLILKSYNSVQIANHLLNIIAEFEKSSKTTK
ncbi:hypothetical protein MATR_05530 [Marivirga tractuosa]|uniref:Glycosyl transferase group 1 n=1 Tax=Marivirga tractuosa (strain ATCC 23168 / DSM 4126 / NBRC 15989 / NCIMB 1408 / VKM B-1430 / H-43) TaxID=643867 RepID=E4TS74_MARTH|nr:glycosyltransferase [Marivirga tractuosa]ADR21814.1 glycosyl transferase group 1 [Marivirga tractuosa DSM 4126]BDD13728.1 hypothetical protein MATR_05530 [Marivirga tractuosa]